MPQNVTVFCCKPSYAEATFAKSRWTQRFLKKPSTLSHVGIHWIAFVEYSHKYYLSSQFVFLHHFVLTNLATTSMRVKLILVSYLFGLSITRMLCSLRGVACMDYFVFNCSKCRLECYVCIH